MACVNWRPQGAGFSDEDSPLGAVAFAASAFSVLISASSPRAGTASCRVINVAPLKRSLRDFVGFAFSSSFSAAGAGRSNGHGAR